MSRPIRRRWVRVPAVDGAMGREEPRAAAAVRHSITEYPRAHTSQSKTERNPSTPTVTKSPMLPHPSTSRLSALNQTPRLWWPAKTAERRSLHCGAEMRAGIPSVTHVVRCFLGRMEPMKTNSKRVVLQAPWRPPTRDHEEINHQTAKTCRARRARNAGD